MAIPSDLMLRADIPGAHRAAEPVERISRPDPLPGHPDTAQSPLVTGKGRDSIARADLRATRALILPENLPGGRRQSRLGDVASIQFLAQILGQDLISAQRPAIRRDSAVLGSDAYRRHGGEPAPLTAQAAIFRFIV